MVDLTIDSYIKIPSTIKTAIKKELIAVATHKDPFYYLQRAAGFDTRNLEPKLRLYWREKDKTLILWRGLLGEVVRVLKKNGCPYNITDNRLTLPKVDLSCTIDLREYQQPALKVMKRRQQTIFRGECGSGKTEVMLAAASYFQQPTLVLVWQERQQKVWLERIPKYFECQVGGIGGAFKDPVIAPITVGMIQSVRNRMDLVWDKFGCVLCDEVQRFAAETLREVVNELPAKYRIGASDDERRRDGRECLLYGTFGPSGYQLKPGTGQAPVTIYLMPTQFKYYIKGWRLNWRDIISGLCADNERNQLVIDIVKDEVAQKRRVIIWSDRVAHCEKLKTLLTKEGIPTGLLLGGVTHKEEADATEAGLNAGTVMVGIGTKVAEQAINIPSLEVGIMTCASADRKMFRFRQMRGRLTRPYEGKTKTLYYLWDREVLVLRNKVKNLKKQYRFKIVRYVRNVKGAVMAVKKELVTRDKMLVGAKQLGLKVKSSITFKELESLITHELEKDQTYELYACNACGRDITNNVETCPFCLGVFKTKEDLERERQKKQAQEDEEVEETLEEEEVEEEEAPDLDDEDEEEEEEEEEEGDGDDDGEEDEDDEEDEEDNGNDEEDEEEDEDEDDFEDEEEIDDDEGGDIILNEDDEDEEEPEEEPTPPPVKKLKKKKKGDPVISKSAERERRRKILLDHAPYTKLELQKMKLATLQMLAKGLGCDPQSILGTNHEKVLRLVLRRQKEIKAEREAKKAEKKPTKKKSTKTKLKKKKSSKSKK